MEKRTLIAVVLSVVVVSVSMLIQGVFTKPEPVVESSQSSMPVQAPVLSNETQVTQTLTESTNVVTVITENESKMEEFFQVSTELADIRFSTKGGDIVSYTLKEHLEDGEPVELLFAGTSGERAFSLAFGDINAKPIQDIFTARRVSDTVIEFSREYQYVNNEGAQKTFKISKRYTFIPNEYMFELQILVDGGTSVPPIDVNGYLYTLRVGPQIGPEFEELNPRYEYRHYFSLVNGKKKTNKVSSRGPEVIDARSSWAAITGKYFTVIGIPDATQYSIAFSNEPVAGLPDSSRMLFSRPLTNSSRTQDVFRFYFGPKTQKTLGIYEQSENNAFKLSDMKMVEAANTSGILAPIEIAMKWFLSIFYKLIPNYGIAIILLTILVKLIMFPLTKKSSESTLRMQSVAPKIKEIQAKYKDNPNKMNVEMAELYKKEGYNPLAGCLPMLLQIPIFIAMYNLFNNHFDLRGAMFIPGWIPDLSIPETIWNFAPFKIPILGWTDLRLLPFIYLLSQLLYGKVTQTPDQQGNSQMKMMLFAMPIVFFFILYEVPSGLLLYWIMSNLLTLVQQLGLNKYLAGKRKELAENAVAPVKNYRVKPTSGKKK